MSTWKKNYANIFFLEQYDASAIILGNNEYEAHWPTNSEVHQEIWFKYVLQIAIVHLYRVCNIEH